MGGMQFYLLCAYACSMLDFGHTSLVPPFSSSEQRYNYTDNFVQAATNEKGVCSRHAPATKIRKLEVILIPVHGSWQAEL